MHKRKLIVALAMLLLIASIGTACTTKSGGEPALAEVIVFEPVTPTPTVEPAPVTTDSPLSTGEYDDMEDSVSPPEGGYRIPIVIDISEADNTALPSTPTPVPVPKATPKPTATPSPAPTATAKPTATPLSAPTPTIPPVPTNTPMSTPAPTLTPMPTVTPAPVLTPAPTPIPEAPNARTICNICGADITGNVPSHGDSHLLNGEDFSYRVE